MAKNKKVVRYRRPFDLNVGLIIFGIIFLYLMFYIFSYFTTVHTSVYEVNQGNIAVQSTYTGLILREETVFTADKSGYINYYLRDGAKTKTNELVYSIDESGTIAKEINELNTDVSNLDTASTDMIWFSLLSFSSSYSSDSFSEVYSFKSDINNQISEALNLTAYEEISDQIATADTSVFTRGYTADDGIIQYYMDGYEGVTQDTFTPSMFDDLNYQKTDLWDLDTINSGDAAYKLVTSENWNILVPVDEEIAKKLSKSSTILVKLKNERESIRVPFLIKEYENANYLVLTLNSNMVRFASDRYINVEILFNEGSGLKIPNSAITTKNFYTIPMEYFQKGNDSDALGIIIRKTQKNGEVLDQFVMPSIYFSTETSYYIDGANVTEGDIILKPNSTDTYTISDTASLEGVYNVNKGYAVFKRIEVMYQNSEYTIIYKNTTYGLSIYDHIALDGSTVVEDEIISSK